MWRRSLVLAVVGSLVLVLGAASVTYGRSEHRLIQVLDACDGPTFTGAGILCTRSGGVTLAQADLLLHRLGEIPPWRFSPGQVTLAEGGSLTAINRGGEFHTFTPVAAFGGGCVAELNLGAPPVPECSNPGFVFGVTGIAPGDWLDWGPLPAGRHLFECLIHPWMRTTVDVS